MRTVSTARKLSIEEVALEAGMEYTHLSRIEHGKINASVYHIYIISKSLNVMLLEIFGELNN